MRKILLLTVVLFLLVLLTAGMTGITGSSALYINAHLLPDGIAGVFSAVMPLRSL